jgi:hypothetical protein
MATISRNIEDIIDCKDDNAVINKSYERFCVDKKHHTNSILLNQLIGPMSEIVNSHLKGINPNDITLMNVIRDNMNKINSTNFDSILESLKTLYYTSEDNFKFLANELISRSMNDNMATRGLIPEDGTLTPSEIYMKVALEFKDLGIIDENTQQQYDFLIIFVRLCNEYFNEFTNLELDLDMNNHYRVNNFKGFMNMVGILYSYGIFPSKMIVKLLNQLFEIITGDNELSQEQRDNYYTGFARIIERVLLKFERSSSTDKLIDEFDDFNKYLKDKNDELIQINNENNIIKRFSLITQKKNMKRFVALEEKYQIKKCIDLK